MSIQGKTKTAGASSPADWKVKKRRRRKNKQKKIEKKGKKKRKKEREKERKKNGEKQREEKSAKLGEKMAQERREIARRRCASLGKKKLGNNPVTFSNVTFFKKKKRKIRSMKRIENPLEGTTELNGTPG